MDERTDFGRGGLATWPARSLLSTEVGAQPPAAPTTHRIDYREVRAQASLERIIEHLDLLKTSQPSGGELRGPCPIDSSDDKRRRDFAVNLKKDVFCCFHPSCAARGNQLDLWALLHDQTTYQAAQDLTNTFQLTTTGLEKTILLCCEKGDNKNRAVSDCEDCSVAWA